MILQIWQNSYWSLELATALTMSGAIIALSGNYALAQSQIVPDSTLGAESSTITTPDSDSPVDEIKGGAIRGTNLFHSFQEFNVSEGRGAYFISPNADIQNILARVTGSNLSEILGTLGTRGGSSPNLFLINPNGILFGQNASLDVGGSFVATTASRLKFADGTDFSAEEHQINPLLTVSVPIGLQFGEDVGKIINQSYATDSEDNYVGLQIQPGKTLALVGGDLTIDGGNLTAESGRIELGSVADSSLVSLNPTTSGWTLGYEGVQNFRDIELSQEALVDTSGVGSGDIQVQGRRVAITDGSVIRATTGARSGGTLTVNASDSVELVGFLLTADDVLRSSLRTITQGNGAAGNLRINTRKLIVQDGAYLSTSTSSTGKGGELQVNATESVNLSGVSSDGASSGLYASTTGEGQGGNITVDTNTFQLTDGAVLGARTRRSGNAGNIIVNANTFEAVRGGQVLTSTFGSGRAGNISLNVPNSVTLSGSDRTYPERLAQLGRNNINNVSADSGLFANTVEGSTGDGGDVTITTGQLNVRDKAEVAVSSEGTGNAGDFQITASSIRLQNQGKLIATITEVGQGGGNITLQDLDLLLLRGNSEISTNAQGAGNGGNINIDTDILAVVDSSNITANAVEGKGGNIRIAVQGLFISPNSRITASSERGINGVVDINRLNIEPSAELAVLPAEIVDVSGLITQGCAAGGDNVATQASEFVITGRGGLPPNPEEATRSDTTLADLGTLVPVQENRASTDISNNSNNSTPTQIVEAQGWITNNKGEVVLIAQAPSITLQIPWLTPATCHASQN